MPAPESQYLVFAGGTKDSTHATKREAIERAERISDKSGDYVNVYALKAVIEPVRTHRTIEFNLDDNMGDC